MGDGDGPRQNLVVLRETRERTMEALREGYAVGLIEVEELERRIELAQEAGTVDDLTRLTEDLQSPPAEQALVRRGPTAVLGADDIPSWGTALAVFSGARRKGTFVVPRTLWVGAVFGGAEIDLREARLGPGVSELRLVALMGGMTIIVPPGLHVTCSTMGIMGGTESVDDSPGAPDPSVPSVRIRGVAVMGGITVTERHVGETAREARRRRKREARALRQRRRDELVARRAGKLSSPAGEEKPEREREPGDD